MLILHVLSVSVCVFIFGYFFKTCKMMNRIIQKNPKNPKKSKKSNLLIQLSGQNQPREKNMLILHVLSVSVCVFIFGYFFKTCKMMNRIIQKNPKNPKKSKKSNLLIQLSGQNQPHEKNMLILHVLSVSVCVFIFGYFFKTCKMMNRIIQKNPKNPKKSKKSNLLIQLSGQNQPREKNMLILHVLSVSVCVFIFGYFFKTCKNGIAVIAPNNSVRRYPHHPPPHNLLAHWLGISLSHRISGGVHGASCKRSCHDYERVRYYAVDKLQK
jgi:uncharacterized protein YneF (UPF0154 family)